MGSSYGERQVKHPLKKAKFGGSKQGIETVEKIESDSQNIYEEIIPGKFEVIVPVVRNGHQHLPLPPVIRERSTTVWGKLQKTDKAAVAPETQKACQDYAQKLSIALNCFGVTKTDFVIDQQGKIWALETDAIPGLSRTGAAGEAAAAAGLSYQQLLNMIKETTWKTTN
jgi:D-alanine-D-alanine ligase